STTNRNGIVTQYEYDATRRATKTTTAAGRPERVTTMLEYLSGAQLPSVEIKNGERSEFTYDDRQRLVTRTLFVNASAVLITRTSWDDLDRPVSETDPYGRRTFRVFDVNDRISRTVKELVPGGVPPGANLSSVVRVTTPNPPYVVEDKAYDAMNQYTS